MPPEVRPDESGVALPESSSDTKETPRRRGKKPPLGEPVVDRALRLLAAFDPTHRSLTLSALSRRADVPLSTTRRLAERLVEWGALEKDAAGRYVIGLRMYEVASLAPRAFGLRELAMPYIDDLYVVTREHVQLGVLEGSHVVLLERRSRPRAVEVEYRIGGQLPMLTTALGLTLLAYLSDRELLEVLEACEHSEDVAAAKRPDLVHEALAEIRRTGIATVTRTDPAPIIAVAAPVRGPDQRVVAALSIVVPAGAHPDSYGPVVRTAARGISRALRSNQL
jgi:DNA-binding IclR family transcriptional regulator